MLEAIYNATRLISKTATVGYKLSFNFPILTVRRLDGSAVFGPPSPLSLRSSCLTDGRTDGLSRQTSLTITCKHARSVFVRPTDRPEAPSMSRGHVTFEVRVRDTRNLLVEWMTSSKLHFRYAPTIGQGCCYCWKERRLQWARGGGWRDMERGKRWLTVELIGQTSCRFIDWSVENFPLCRHR